MCVSKLWAAGRAGGAEVHNQKQEPHTKMWGVTIIITDLTKKRRKKNPSLHDKSAKCRPAGSHLGMILLHDLEYFVSGVSRVRASMFY